MESQQTQSPQMPLILECRDCAGRGPQCHDCVVCLVLEGLDETVPSLTAEERRAVAVLTEAGMVSPWGSTSPVEVRIMSTPHRWRPPDQQAN